MKHNKKRNTCFIYKALINECTQCILENQKERKDKIIKILKEFFSSKKPLKKELNIYLSFIDNNEKLSEQQYSQMMEEAKREYESINKKQIFNEQTKLIGMINRELEGSTFNIFMPNYKSMASLWQIFNKTERLKTRKILESKIINELSNPDKKDEMIPISNFVYNNFIDKYNEKYSGLLDEQKRLLITFINSISDDGELKLLVGSEIENLREKLNKPNESFLADKDMLQKRNEIIEMLNEFKTRKVDKEVLYKILQIQELVNEIQQ